MKIGNTYIFHKMKINLNTICAMLFTYASLIMVLAPYQHDVLGTDFMRQLIRASLYIVAILVGGIVIAFKRKTSIIIFIPIIYFMIYNLWISEYASASTEFLSMLLLTIFLAAGEEIWEKVFIYYRKALIILAAISCIVFLSYVLLLPIPYKVEPYYSSLEWQKAYYIDYGICYLLKVGAELRLCCIFDEPGFFGTICALILCADHVNLKGKGNWILIIAGILTFSLAFIVILFLYLMFSSIKSRRAFLALFIILLLYIFALPNIKTNIANVDLILNRMITVSGKLAGDNRSNDILDNLLVQTLKYNTLFGHGRGYAHYFAMSVASFKILIVDYGIIGFFIIVGMLAISAFRYTKDRVDMRVFVLCFLASIYQRPDVYALPYFIVLYGGLIYMKTMSMKKAPILNKSQMVKEKYCYEK